MLGITVLGTPGPQPECRDQQQRASALRWSWLWHPIDLSELAATARTLPQVDTYTMLWLNDAEHRPAHRRSGAW
jgi:hypothetical protein